MAQTKNDARLNVRLPSSLKELIEQAASRLGQSVSDFAVGALSQSAHQVLYQQNVTELSERDRDLFLQLLDDADVVPAPRLVAAAQRYKERFE